MKQARSPGLSRAATLMAVGTMLAWSVPTPAAEPPGISLEIGNTPTPPSRRTPGAGGAAGGETGIAASETAAPTPGPLLSVTAPGERHADFRRWGHLVGDRIRTCVALATGQRAGRIPTDHDAGRVGLWFDRQATLTVEAGTPDGGRALCIDYQIVNSPRTTMIAILPAVTLAADDGSPLTIAATSVSLGPLIPDEGVGTVAGAPPVLIGDRDAAGFVRQPDRANLGRSALALTLVLAGWLGFAWWQRGRDRLRQPFTGALHQLRRLRHRGGAESPRAWQAVHEAINRSAGRTVSAAGLPALLQDRPWLAPFGPRLAQFFAASDARFFAQATTAEAFPLEALCADLRRAERVAAFEVAPSPASGDDPPDAGTTGATGGPRP